MKIGLAPIVDKYCKILILGSLPSELSIYHTQYYANPRNHFWQIILPILQEPMFDRYEDKIQALLKHNIALWDVIRFAERDGSLDSSIKNAVPNDLEKFLYKYKNIKKIVLNGNEAAKQYEKYFFNLSVKYIKVRSSSPIPTQKCNSIEEKIIDWKTAIIDY